MPFYHKFSHKKIGTHQSSLYKANHKPITYKTALHKPSILYTQRLPLPKRVVESLIIAYGDIARTPNAAYVEATAAQLLAYCHLIESHPQKGLEFGIKEYAVRMYDEIVFVLAAAGWQPIWTQQRFSTKVINTFKSMSV